MTKEQVAEFRQHFRANIIPSWYNGVAHVVFNFSVLIGLFIFFLLMISSPSWLELLMIPVTMVIGNLAVYVIHRYLLHQNYPYIGEHTYKIHTKWHHHFYTDQFVIYEGTKDFYILFFPPTVIILFAFVHVPVAYMLLKVFLPMNAVFLYLAFSTLYFLLYEILHYISHLPQDHKILRIPFFRLMWHHHVDHHNPRLMQDYNFNIVFPLFDHVFKTVFKK